MLRASARAAALAALALAAGCTSANATDGLAQVAELSQRIEAVRASAQGAHEKVAASVHALQTIAALGFDGDAAAAYAEFVTSVDASAAQVEELRASVEKAKKNAGPLFQEWQENLAAIESEAMRQHSQQRQQETRARFDVVIESAAAAQTACEALNKSLRDHVAYLRFDLTSAALKAIGPEVESLAQRAALLDAQLGSCQDGARSYVEAASLPKKSR
jgi:hypothetical protein